MESSYKIPTNKKGNTMIPKLIETYCLIDNLTRELDKKLKTKLSGRKSKLSRSELLTIAVIKQNLGIRTYPKIKKLEITC